MVYTYGTTIEQALEKYLKKVGRPELIRDNTNKICFLFNATQLKFGNKTKVEVFFKNINNPKVVVNDVNNLIGAWNFDYYLLNIYSFLIFKTIKKNIVFIF